MNYKQRNISSTIILPKYWVNINYMIDNMNGFVCQLIKFGIGVDAFSNIRECDWNNESCV